VRLVSHPTGGSRWLIRFRNVPALAKATPKQARQMVTNPDNVMQAVIFNDEQAASYLTKYKADWQTFQLKK
jgi:hypothetical protein